MEYGVDPRLLGFQKKNEIKIQEDKQLDKFTYTGSKIKNQFTAYILAQIRGARQNYLRKMLRISRNEMPAEDLTMEEMGISVEESLELKYREELLLKEADGDYPKWDEMKDQKLTLLFLLFAVVMFVLEKIPLGVTSMLVCIGLVVTGVLDVKTAFAGFVDSNVILFVAMFIVGGALFETGMANKIGGIVTKFAKTERMLIVAIMIIVGLMSGVLSNTGTAAVLIPVVIGIANKSGYKRSRLLMPLVFAAAMGGNLSLIGAPGNLIAQSALEELGLKFGFFEYAIAGLPILVVGIIFYATVGYKLLPNHDVKDDGAFDTQKAFGNVPAWKQWLSLVILILTLLAMIFEDKIGIKLCVSGGIGALLLILTGVISEKDALKSIDLKTIFLFGGTLSLASALQNGSVK